MAKHQYVTGALFDDDDESDVEDTHFFRSRVSYTQKPTASYYDGCMTSIDQQTQINLQQKKLEIEQRTLEHASKSVALLCDTEDIGIRAANELAHQGEQLHNTNLKLDEIDNNLKIGQKHINGIKSVFHGLKNYISAKADLIPVSKRKVTPKMHSAGINHHNRHFDKNNLSRPASSEKFYIHPSTHLQNLEVQISAEPVINNQVNDILDANIGEMVHHLSNLKVLGVEFGNQINHQNELIDTIQNKVEVVDVKIAKQNKEMNKILGK